MKEVKIRDITGGQNWISSDEGLQVYNAIYPDVKSGSGVCLSFEGRQFVTTAFLNAAIGKFYNGEFSDDDLLKALQYSNVDEDDTEKINRVVARAKEYYKDPEIHDAVLKEVH